MSKMVSEGYSGGARVGQRQQVGLGESSWRRIEREAGFFFSSLNFSVVGGGGMLPRLSITHLRKPTTLTAYLAI